MCGLAGAVGSGRDLGVSLRGALGMIVEVVLEVVGEVDGILELIVELAVEMGVVVDVDAIVVVGVLVEELVGSSSGGDGGEKKEVGARRRVFIAASALQNEWPLGDLWSAIQAGLPFRLVGVRSCVITRHVDRLPQKFEYVGAVLASMFAHAPVIVDPINFTRQKDDACHCNINSMLAISRYFQRPCTEKRRN
jgi:hypothetical protein